MAKRREIAKKLVEEEKIPLAMALKAMFLSKSSYYYTPESNVDGRRRKLDEGLSGLLRMLQGYELIYGYRKVTHLLDYYNH